MLSIVIPTLNEERYLPKLLSSIKEQDFKQKYEIIVADANSKDATRDIAKKYGCGIVQGGKHSRGINNGIKASKYNIILCLDADVLLPKSFLTTNLEYFKKRKLDVGICYCKPLSKNFFVIFAHIMANFHILLFHKIKPYIPGFCFLIKKDVFFKLGKFDESIEWFDDLEFSIRLGKSDYKSGISPKYISVVIRKIKEIGLIKYSYIVTKLTLYRLFNKAYKSGW